MPDLIIATQNPGKVAELRAMLAPTGLRVLGLDDLGDPPPEPDEAGSSFDENTAIKALAYARATGRPCLADDSGLVVDALGGRPGVISSHYAFGGRTDGEAAGLTREQRDDRNNARLLSDLEGVEPERRTARFVCVMALAHPGAGGVPALFPGAGGVPAPRSGAARSSSPSKPPYNGDFTKHTRGRLPHWDVRNATCFLTFHAARGVTFSTSERRMILDACLHWHDVRYWLHTACVMPDHVHMLFRTIEQADDSWPRIADLAHSLKSFTAGMILKCSERRGPIWQREYFDRLVRSGEEMVEAHRYIQKNPVEAGLVERAMEYPFLWRQNDPCLGDAGSEGEIGLRPIGGQGRPPLRGEGILAVTHGHFEGRIGLPGDVPRGPGGFGYDPLFLVGPDFTRTSAELGKEEKNRLSHRGEALRAMVERLRGMG